MYSGAGRIASAVDENVPKSLARSFIDTESIIILKNSILCVG